jgi:hypothetical protein
MATRASFGASSAIERLNLNSTATLQRGFKAKEKRDNGNVASEFAAPMYSNAPTLVQIS